ncbi:MAG: PAS domain-containing protein [Desulfobacterales bacterium]|jgi:PAS domain S-box-containing protein
MKLRIILIVLSLLAFLSASTGGYLYYSSLKESALKEAERQADQRLRTIKKNLSIFLAENVKPVKTLAGMKPLELALTEPNSPNLAAANAILDHFNKTLAADVCYLMDPDGNTIASTNRDAPDSFVGQNFAFRPYFKDAISGYPGTYLALGTTSSKRGAYYSHPVFADNGYPPVGIVVIKASIEYIESQLGTELDEIVLVNDPNGVIFISNRKDWLYHLLWKYNENNIPQIKQSLQFGTGPWKWTGLESKDGYILDRDGHVFQIHVAELGSNYPDWNVVYLRRLDAITQAVIEPLIKTTGPIVLALCVLIGIAVFFLYRQASHEIRQRRSAERARRSSEERFRSLYHHTPAMLHSIDPEGRLVSVSAYWAEVMGYGRDEVIGRRLTDFFTPDSREYAETTVIPEFFKTGFCQDIPYQFIKKNGEKIDVLLSAIADRDTSGNIIRSLAVSIDVTQRNRAEAALKQAKEELSLYSRDLERLVRKQTEEITDILTYTPAVVYIKDKAGRYTLVNTRYEELFAVRNAEIRGKTDYDILPQNVADQFRASDAQVLKEGRSLQLEEHIQQSDGWHTYLAVKFPIYDESGAISGVCGILNDITAVKKAQTQLRRLSGSIMANQEKERSAIARELHDELGQVLTALRMDSVWMHERLKKADPEAAERALTMCRLIDKNIEDVRGMAFRLRPGVLDDLGLVDALESYTTDFEKRTEIACVFEHNDVASLGDGISTAAYRIAQEALTNVARHAAANHVEVVLKTHNNLLTLAVVDDGQGFEPQHLSESEGLGVAGMRERAALVGGSLEVHSQPRKGTRVSFKVPLDGRLGSQGV